jgi:hypothetical protein
MRTSRQAMTSRQASCLSTHVLCQSRVTPLASCDDKSTSNFASACHNCRHHSFGEPLQSSVAAASTRTLARLVFLQGELLPNEIMRAHQVNRLPLTSFISMTPRQDENKRSRRSFVRSFVRSTQYRQSSQIDRQIRFHFFANRLPIVSPPPPAVAPRSVTCQRIIRGEEQQQQQQQLFICLRMTCQRLVSVSMGAHRGG